MSSCSMKNSKMSVPWRIIARACPPVRSFWPCGPVAKGRGPRPTPTPTRRRGAAVSRVRPGGRCGGRADRPGRRPSVQHCCADALRRGDLVHRADGPEPADPRLERQLAAHEARRARGWRGDVYRHRKRNAAQHRVWVRLESRQAACGCKAFLQEGTCGHCDAAVLTAEQMGLVAPDLATSASEGTRPAELRSRAVQKGLAVLPSQQCFSGLAAKSRELNCLSGLLRRGGSDSGARTAPGTSLPVAVPALAAAPAAQGPRRNKAPKAEVPSHGVQEVNYLSGDSYVAARLSVLAKAPSRDKVYLRAYSFDAPSILDALEGACARGAA